MWLEEGQFPHKMMNKLFFVCLFYHSSQVEFKAFERLK